MNITGRQTRTTIVFGFICAVAFVPARMITDYIDLIQYPTDFRLILWIYLTGYAFLLTRWGKIPGRRIFFSLLLPLLFIGVLVAGALLGRPGGEGLIPPGWISGLVGGNSIRANLFASVAGAFMYFATLTEVPILQGLLGAGMGKGPALALLLAGPALSLPNMLVIRSIMGTRRTLVFIILICIMATISGLNFGTFWG